MWRAARPGAVIYPISHGDASDSVGRAYTEMLLAVIQVFSEDISFTACVNKS
jgi:hypothetical protein